MTTSSPIVFKRTKLENVITALLEQVDITTVDIYTNEFDLYMFQLFFPLLKTAMKSSLDNVIVSKNSACIVYDIDNVDITKYAIILNMGVKRLDIDKTTPEISKTGFIWESYLYDKYDIVYNNSIIYLNNETFTTRLN